MKEQTSAHNISLREVELMEKKHLMCLSLLHNALLL